MATTKSMMRIHHFSIKNIAEQPMVSHNIVIEIILMRSGSDLSCINDFM